jgi:hypothetical protein
MAKSILQFIKRVAGSRIGQVIFIIHLSLFVFEIARKPPVPRMMNNAIRTEEIMPSMLLFAGRPFHFAYESSLFQFLFLVDLPGAMLLSIIFSALSYPIFLVIPPLGEYDESWVGAIVFLCGASIQWLLVGYCIEHIICRKRNSE